MTRAVQRAQNVSRMCVVCGVDNSCGLRGHFYEVEGGEVVGVFSPGSEHQGYPGRMHGGLIAALLDETIGRAINVLDPAAWGVTVELNVKYRKPVPLDVKIRAVGRIVGEPRKMFRGTGELVLADGTVAAEAQGTYLRVPIEQITSVEFVEDEWFADPVEAPAEVEL